MGPRQRVLRVQGLGLHRAGSSTDDLHADTTWKTSSTAPWARPPATSPCSTRRTTLPASTSGRTASTGRRRTRPTDACEEFIVNEFAPHIKAFDSYPGSAYPGQLRVSQVWNGDARQGLTRPKNPSGTPGASVRQRPSCGWTTGDREGRAAPGGRLRWINFILDPANSLQDLEFHGYNTGITGVKEAAEAATFRSWTWCSSTTSRSPRSGPAP